MAASRTRPLEAGEIPELDAIARDLARRADVPVPRLYLIGSGQPNAFATGRDPAHAAVAVTDGLLQQLPPEEVRGVLAHEFAHIKNRGTLVAIIVAPIAATLLQLGVSRQREYLADGTGAQLLGRAGPLADALEALERPSLALPMNVNPATASLYAVNPLPRQGIATLFMTHPPIIERIRRLRALDGEHAVALAA